MKGEKGLGHAFRSKIRNLVIFFSKISHKFNVCNSGGSAKRESSDATDKVREKGQPKQICGEKEEGGEDFIMHIEV